MSIETLAPAHPGKVLKAELDALGLSARKFAAHIHVPPNAVTAILNGSRAVTAQMALRLGQALGASPGYWMRLQALYEVKTARVRMGDVLSAIRPLGEGVSERP
jgi:addiction module HigA family antidote